VRFNCWAGRLARLILRGRHVSAGNDQQMTRWRRLSVAVLAACTAVAGPPPTTAAEPARLQGLDVAGIDRAIAPGDDFFGYANGLWVKSATIPADRSSWGPAGELTELTAQRTAQLIRQAAASPAGSEARKVSDYYSSFMDEAGIEKLGLKPVEPGLKQIDAISDRAALARAFGKMLRADVDVLNATNLHGAGRRARGR
jgi:putative endopeptidase